jgi:hypothetical protein
MESYLVDGAHQQILAGASGGPTRINAEVRDDLLLSPRCRAYQTPTGQIAGGENSAVGKLIGQISVRNNDG